MLYIEIQKNSRESPSQDREPAKAALRDVYPAEVHTVEMATQKAFFYLTGEQAALKEKNGRVYFFDGFISDWGPVAKTADAIDAIVDLFEAGEEKLLAALEGRFLFGYYEERTSRFRLFSDKYGMRSLFFVDTAEVLMLSSRYQALLPHADFRKTLSLSAVEEYFLFGLILEDKTFFSELNQLPRGAALCMDGGVVKVSNPSEIPVDESWAKLKITDVVDAFYERMQNSLRFLVDHFDIQLMLLTGGSDSRVLLGCMPEEQRRRMKFSTACDPRWSKDNLDLAVAKELSEKFQLDHIVYDMVDGDKAFPTARPAYVFQQPKMPIMTGMYGTELLGQGAWSFLSVRYSHYRQDRYRKLREQIFDPSQRASFSPFDKIVEGVEAERGACREYRFMTPFFWRSFFSDIYATSGGHNFIAPYEQPNGNKVSPFLMPAVLDLLFNLPYEYLVNYRIYEVLFQEKLKDLAQVPFKTSMSNYVSSIQRTEKKGRPHSPPVFPYAEFLDDHRGHPALDLPLFDKKGLLERALDGKSYDFLVRTVEFVFWYEFAIEGNLSFGESYF